MRLNKYVALATGMSRRAADGVIADGRVSINGQAAQPGQSIQPEDSVTLDGHIITPADKRVTIMLNKPVGYVCSREGQGSRTIYDLLPEGYHQLKPVGRLDKNSSGLLLLTNDGDLAHKLTHPSFQKEKVYSVEIDHNLSEEDFDTITKKGVALSDGLSKLGLKGSDKKWEVRMREGRNRQIRRTFEALRYKVTKLHRTHFGPFVLAELPQGNYRQVESNLAAPS